MLNINCNSGLNQMKLLAKIELPNLAEWDLPRNSGRYQSASLLKVAYPKLENSKWSDSKRELKKTHKGTTLMEESLAKFLL